MEKQIKANEKPGDIDSGVKNHKLAKKAKQSNMVVSELEEKVVAADARKKHAKIAFENTQSDQPVVSTMATRLVQRLDQV